VIGLTKLMDQPLIESMIGMMFAASRSAAAV
jgi:hypothetical protein